MTVLYNGYQCSKKSATQRKKENEVREDFKWTDDESELLLSVTHDYKVKKVSENVDWESVKINMMTF